MMTRRILILLGASLGPCIAASAGEFWNDKQPSDWSEEETQRLLTKSPWAVEAVTEINFGSMRGQEEGGGRAPGGPGMGGPGMGGPRGPGGPGGPGMGGPGMGGPGGEPPQIKAVVRWESAQPIRDAAKHQLPQEAAGAYVISVWGLPKMDAGRRAPGGESSSGDDRMAQMHERLKQSTSLRRKGKDPVVPAQVQFSDTDGTVAFYFPIGSDPISAEDKEVVFQTKLGPMELKAKFTPKKMNYRGKLAL